MSDALRLVRAAVRAMKPYVPGLQPGPAQRLVKLNTNENPYPPSPRAVRALRASARGLPRYPDPQSRALRAQAAAVYGLPSEEWVLAGNGSDELLAIVMRTFIDEGETIAYFQPSYSLYPVLAAASRAREIPLPLPRDPAGLAVPSPAARVFFLTTPNAPYGFGFPTSWVARLLDSFAGIVVADEAYVDFAAESCLPLLAANERLLVVRTLSKAYSLAGLRVGLAFAHPSLIGEMSKVRDSYNLDRPAQAAATEALADQRWFRRNRDRVLATRRRFAARLASAGFTVLPSDANFVFVVPPSRPPGAASARAWYDHLLARGYLVRHFDRPGLADGLRISIGTEAEMSALAGELEAALRGDLVHGS